MSTGTVRREGTRHERLVSVVEEAPVKIVGRGTLASNGLPFLLVSSASEVGRVHCVAYAYEGAYVGARICCDCEAANHGRSCKHVRLVTAWLIEQMTTAPLGASVSPPSEPVEPEPPDARDTAVLRRNNRPFTMLKT